MLPIDKVVIVGLSYSGKTYYAEELIKNSRRRVIFSTKPRDYRKPHREYLSVRELLRNPGKMKGDDICLVVYAENEGGRELENEVVTLIKFVRRACSPEHGNLGGCVFILDEMGDYSGAPHALVYGCIGNLARNGRHDSCVPIFISQDAIEIPLPARKQATRIISFIQTEKKSLQYLRDKTGSDEFIRKVESWNVGDPPATWILRTVASMAARGNFK